MGSTSFIALVCVLLGLVYLMMRMTGHTVGGTISGGQVLFHERVVLNEGEARDYRFSVNSSRQVELNLTSSPENVNIVLMNDGQWGQWMQARGKLFGGGYQYFRDLSARNVNSLQKIAILPEGQWHIVVERPREALLFRESTTAVVKIVTY